MENENKKQEEEAPVEPVKKNKSFNPKVFLFGLPLFIVQLVVVYFVTVNFILSSVDINATSKPDSLKSEQKSNAKTNSDIELGKFIYSIEDIIVNPANTEGKRLLLTSVGFDLGSEAELKKLQTKEILVKDVIVSVLSSKDMNKLSSSTYRDTLKTEIGSKVHELLPDIKLNMIYLSKYILQ